MKLLPSDELESGEELELFATEPSSECAECKAVCAKYSCPTCRAALCSSDCSKTHKARHVFDSGAAAEHAVSVADTCSFESDRKFFTKIAELLESGSPYMLPPSAVHDKLFPQSETAFPAKAAQLASAKLKKRAQGLGILFRTAPFMTELHRCNTSRVCRKYKNVIRWKLDLQFNGAIFTHRAVPSDRSIAAVIEQLLADSLPADWQRSYRLLFPDESLPSNARGFYAVDPAANLNTFLPGLIVTEHVTLQLVPNEACSFEPHKCRCAAAAVDVPFWAKQSGLVRGNYLASYENRCVHAKIDLPDYTAFTVLNPNQVNVLEFAAASGDSETDENEGAKFPVKFE